MYSHLKKKKATSLQTNEVSQKKALHGDILEYVDRREDFAAQQKVNHITSNTSPQPRKMIQKQENNTGLPDSLKSGIENLSGHSMDDVKVHYNSSKPSQLNAHAYAQGTEIHLASGQEKHLPHEAWHVVQQKQGRVKPTMQMKDKVSINDDVELEKEADEMGGMAMQFSRQNKLTKKKKFNPGSEQKQAQRKKSPNSKSLKTVQRVANLIPPANPLMPAENAKLNQVHGYINNMLANLPNAAAIPDVDIIVDDRNDYDPSPAYTRLNNNIEIELARWYLKMASVGEITGMLSHELGVHTLADERMTPMETQAETNANPNAFNQRIGLFNYNLKPLLGAPNDNRQEDHVNVVKDDGTGPQANRARTRMYVNTMLRLGDQIDVNGKTLSERNEELRDLLKTFLFDYARILATDDGKAASIFSNAHYIGDVFNWYRDVIIRRHAGQHNWLNRKALQPNAGGWDLRGYLLGKLGMMIAARTTDKLLGENMGSKVRNTAGTVADISSKTIGTIGKYSGINHLLWLPQKVVGFGARYAEAGTKASLSLGWKGIKWGYNRLF